MRTRTLAAGLVAAAALTAGAVAPAGAGISLTVTLDPNPAHVGDTVTVTPRGGCPDVEAGEPFVEVEVTGPENQSQDLATTYNEGTSRYEWSADFTAGPVGVYSVTATCVYDGPAGDPPLPQALVYPYAPATLQVIAAQVTTTTTTTTTAPTTTAPTTTTTTAPTTAASTTAAPPAAPVAASPRYTG